MTAEPAIDTLARERPLVTRELHVQNDYYGHAELLKRYAGIPTGHPLKATIEHGVVLHQQFWQLELESPLPLFLCSSERRARLFERRGPAHRYGVPIGPMIAYAPAPMHDERSPRRLLLIPAHSTHHVSARYDVDRFVDHALDGYPEVDEVEVCLYWKDVLEGVHERFRRPGLRCFTAGHLHDPLFLVRLRQLLRRADAVVTNSVGSHIFYALLENKPVWFLQQELRWTGRSPAVMIGPEDPTDPYAGETEPLHRLFVDPLDQPSEEQLAYADEVSGLSLVRTPGEMREILRRADSIYRRQRGRLGRTSDRARSSARLGRAWARRKLGGAA